MKVLLVGNGGREHALARSMVRTSAQLDLVVQAGNPGIDALGHPITFDPLAPQEVLLAAQQHAVDLVVIGPEARWPQALLTFSMQRIFPLLVRQRLRST